MSASAPVSSAESTMEPRARWYAEPATLLMIVAGLAALLISAGPISDIDSWWHVRIGQEILDRHTVSGLGDAWSAYQPDTAWVTTQWLSEVIMAWVVDAFGWSGLVWARGIASVAFVVLLGAMVLNFGPPRAAAICFTLAVVPSAGIMQERPQLVSLLLLIGVAWSAGRVLLGGSLPPWWAIAAYTWLWANLHGLWILVAATVALLALGALCDRDQPARATLRQFAPGFVAAVVAGCLTPAGLATLTAPLRFSAAASGVIEEWQSTRPWGWFTAGLLALLAILIVCWARQPGRVRWSHLLFVGAWTALALMAWRNVLPAVIMIAPLATATLTAAYSIKPATTGKIERRALAGAAALLVLAGTVWWVAEYVRTDPFADTKPLEIARALNDLPRDEDGTLRILNAYNTAGILLEHGGPGVVLGIDGRTDRFGPDVIERYLDALELTDGWEDTVSELDPDVAVLVARSPLALELEDRGWTIEKTDGDYVLLVPDRP